MRSHRSLDPIGVWHEVLSAAGKASLKRWAVSSETVARQVQAWRCTSGKGDGRRKILRDSEQVENQKIKSHVVAESVYPFPLDADSSACGLRELPVPGDFHPGSTPKQKKAREKTRAHSETFSWGIPAISYKPQCHPLLPSEAYLYYFKNNFKIALLK